MRFLLLLTLLPLAACARTGPHYPRLTIATDATFPPFHYIDDDGTITGYDVAVATEACKRARYLNRVVHIPDYDQLFADLRDLKVDMVAATTGITPERQEIYLFTEPYYETCQAALVRAGPNEPRTLADLRGNRVGASGSGTSSRAMMSLEGVEHVHVQPDQSGLDMLREGRIDALVIDEYDVVALAREHDDLTVIPEPVALEQYAIVLAPDSHELKARLDKALQSMKADGTLRRLRDRYALYRPLDWPIDLD